MTRTEYFVDQITSTPADTLVAFGLTRLLAELNPEEDVGLKIEDGGGYYRVSLDAQGLDGWLTDTKFFSLLKGLDTAKRQAALPDLHKVDYVAHQQRNRAFFDARKGGQDEGALRDQGLTPPGRDWPAWAMINQMSATGAYNKLAEIWYAHHECFPMLLKIILDLYGSFPNDIEAAATAWKKLAKEADIDASVNLAQLQVVNPGKGKGGNRSKADGLGIGGLKGFWLPEYLKFVGLFQAALPRTVSGSKDRKLYVLRPRALVWRTHKQVFPKFQEIFYARSAIKMDILAILRYCRIFLEQWKEGQATGRFKWSRGQPGDHVSAIETVSFKHLGSAHATMNLSTLVLPLWLPLVESIEQADQFLALLDEHEGVVRGLEEKHGDAYELLRQYRNFLSAQDLRAFYRFTRGYGGHVMRQSTKGGFPPRRFTIPNLEVLIMSHNPKLAPILQDEGFQHVAEAIRRSTVNLQYQKGQGRELLYEIRYGLGDKLLRHAQYTDKFVQELSRFMHDYNRENARKSQTRKQQFRSNLTIDDIAAIVALIDTYGAPTVGNLLVAFGYARDPSMGKSKESTEEGATDEVN